jgi:hypothetical protein
METPSLQVTLTRERTGRPGDVAVFDQFRDRGPFAAQRTIGVPLDADFSELSASCIEVQQAIGQRATDAEDQLQRLGGLDGPDDAGQHTDDTGFLAGGNEPLGRRLLKDATITSRLLRDDGGDATIESKNAAVHQRFAGEEAGIVDEEFRRESYRRRR